MSPPSLDNILQWSSAWPSAHCVVQAGSKCIILLSLLSVRIPGLGYHAWPLLNLVFLKNLYSCMSCICVHIHMLVLMEEEGINHPRTEVADVGHGN